MPDVSIILHLHHPFHPARFDFQEPTGSPVEMDMISTRESFLQAADILLGPLTSMLSEVLGRQSGIGLTVSGPLLSQCEQWSPATLEALKQAWRLPGVEILPQPADYTPGVVWDRDSWLRSLQQYREKMALLGATLSPVCWNPGYLFIRYLAWPLQDSGIRGCLVDGDSFGWSGSMANRISKVPFQHSFRMQTRNSWWSQGMEQLQELSYGPIAAAQQLLTELAACQESPVTLAVDLSHWLSRPGLVSSGIELLRTTLETGESMGIRWVSPGQAISEHEPTADWSPTDWVVLPAQRGLLQDAQATPVSGEVLATWKEIQHSGKQVPSGLIDTQLLGTLDAPNQWVAPGLGKAGQVYSRLMGQLAAITRKS